MILKEQEEEKTEQECLSDEFIEMLKDELKPTTRFLLAVYGDEPKNAKEEV